MIDPQFDLAERIAEIARSLNVEIVLIGATALAAYGYVRATSDIDFASVTDPYANFPKLQSALEGIGLRTKLIFPDGDDPLGGKLVAWLIEDEEGEPIDPIEIVNFYNPHRVIHLPTKEILREAIQVADKPGLRFVQLRHLILLKMYAGDIRDHADVVAILEKNPEADLEEIIALCRSCGLSEIDGLIARVKQGKFRSR